MQVALPVEREVLRAQQRRRRQAAVLAREPDGRATGLVDGGDDLLVDAALFHDLSLVKAQTLEKV